MPYHAISYGTVSYLTRQVHAYQDQVQDYKISTFYTTRNMQATSIPCRTSSHYMSWYCPKPCCIMTCQAILCHALASHRSPPYLTTLLNLTIKQQRRWKMLFLCVWRVRAMPGNFCCRVPECTVLHHPPQVLQAPGHLLHLHQPAPKQLASKGSFFTSPSP